MVEMAVVGAIVIKVEMKAVVVEIVGSYVVEDEVKMGFEVVVVDEEDSGLAVMVVVVATGVVVEMKEVVVEAVVDVD